MHRGRLVCEILVQLSGARLPSEKIPWGGGGACNGLDGVGAWSQTVPSKLSGP
jgi:hypothetical protein